MVSDADQERELQRLTAAVRFTEGLGGDALAQSIEQSTAYRREKFFFAYVVGALQRAGLTDLRSETSKYPILVAINLVNYREADDAKVLRRPSPQGATAVAWRSRGHPGACADWDQ